MDQMDGHFPPWHCGQSASLITRFARQIGWSGWLQRQGCSNLFSARHGTKLPN
jgi:hypothetical protein